MHVRDRISKLQEELTPSERKLSAALLSDYPFAGLEPIQVLADKTQVSAPSITRFVHKLGFQGFQDFQRGLISELKESQRSPVDLYDTREPPKGAFLGDVLARASAAVTGVADSVTEAQFERVCAVLRDEKRSVYVIGGRVSDAVAQHLSRHLRQIRRGVVHVPSDPELWPDFLLRMKPRDVLVMVDFRRYQPALAKLAALAQSERRAAVTLITDKWISPIARHASEVLAVPIECGTAWDSYVGAIALIEAMVVKVSDADWDATRQRIEAWESVRLDHGEMKDEA